MTDNHLLLYRLAEIMLEQEKHILPIDLLFDDEKIGDFVKSIQIDSPYQQMLLEGVLSESVREEKLYVSFTVEGYFHYVLGEVIYYQTFGKNAEALKQIVEKNKLNGVKEGVEQCLIRDVQKDELSRLMWMIDQNDSTLNCSIIPLVNAFNYDEYKEEFNSNLIKSEKGRSFTILERLLENPTNKDIRALIKTIELLRSYKKSLLIKSIYNGISQLILPETFEKAILCVEAIDFLPIELRKDKLFPLLETILDFPKEKKTLLLFLLLGERFFSLSEYDYSKKCFDIILKLGKKLLEEDDQIFIACYNNLASIYNRAKKYKEATKFQKKALNLSLKKYGTIHRYTALYYRNLGVCYSNSENWKKSIQNLQFSLRIEAQLSGEYDENFAHSLVNLSVSYKNMKDFENAISSAEKALTIYTSLFGEDHIFSGTAFNNLGTIYSSMSEFEKSIYFLEKANEITIKHNGVYSYTSASSFHNLALIKLELGQIDESISYFIYSRKIKQKILGERHISIAHINFSIGETYGKKDDFINAIKSIKLALTVYTKNQALIYQAKCNDYLGDFYVELKDQKSALKYFKRALNLCNEVLGEGHFRSLSVKNKISIIQSK